MTHEAHENNILRAYRLGIEHGQQNEYNPPLWIIAKTGLWLTAYQTGYNKGQRARLAVRRQA